VGLVLNSLQSQTKTEAKYTMVAEEASSSTESTIEETEEEPNEAPPKERKRFFDKWAEKFKEFLDNAE